MGKKRKFMGKLLKFILDQNDPDSLLYSMQRQNQQETFLESSAA